MLFEYSILNLEMLTDLLRQLPDQAYSQPCRMLSGSSIGHHTRHIAELYEELLNGYNSGAVSYDNRKRNKQIENNCGLAAATLEDIAQQLQQPDKALLVSYLLNEQPVALASNYHREVMYNLEHAIHHMALIKVGLLELNGPEVPAAFGVAPATLQYRAQCAPSA